MNVCWITAPTCIPSSTTIAIAPRKCICPRIGAHISLRPIGEGIGTSPNQASGNPQALEARNPVTGCTSITTYSAPWFTPAASFIQPGFWVLLGIMLLFSWMALVGLVRAEFLRGRNFDYVRAARALGMMDARIMYRHILPNAMTASLTFLPFILAGSVTTLTSLDFLGFGLPVGSPSLGELLLQGKNNLTAPWLAFTGFFVIALMLSLLVFIGEAVRDAFNPRKVLA